MKTAPRTLVALAALATALAVGSAQAHGRHGGHHHGHWGAGLFWGGVVGVGLGVAAANYYYGPPWYPGYVVVEPPPYAYPPSYNYPPPPPMREPVAKGPPEPIFYPRNGQSAAQAESDRQACNRWAMTQSNAMADASVFHRATLACMEGRGYTVR